MTEQFLDDLVQAIPTGYLAEKIEQMGQINDRIRRQDGRVRRSDLDLIAHNARMVIEELERWEAR